MATKFAKGDVVKLSAVVPSGPVQSIRMDEDGVIYYMISWVDDNQCEQCRWFSEDKLTQA